MPLSIGQRIDRWREKKNRNYREALSEKTGILYSSDLTAEKEGFPFLKYAVNALALFCGTFGSLYCLISSFELDLSLVPLFFTCVVSALALSFMYVSFRTKIINYLIILAAAITVSTRFFAVVNSGMSAIWNNILKYIDDKIDLPYLREFTLIYKDEYTAMTIAVCVLAVGIMIMQNINVSEKMSLRGFFLFSSPIVMFGMYFNFSAAKAGMIMVVISWVLVMGTGFTNSYDGLNDSQSARSYIKKHLHRYTFATGAKNTARIAVIWLVFILVVTGLVFAVVPSETFEINLPTNFVKDSTVRPVKNFLSYGFSSLYSRDRQASEPGQLSNVSSVTFDGMTDIEVELVNYRVNRIYLRNYCGYDFDSSALKWKPGKTEDPEGKLFNFTANLLEKDFNSEKSVTQSSHRIALRTVDPALFDQPVSVPYYAALDGEKFSFESPGQANLKSETAEEKSAFIYYTAYTRDNYEPGANPLEALTGEEKEQYESLLDEIRADAYDNALTVPPGSADAAAKFCEEYGISQDDTQDVKIEKVTSALENNFEYTLRPGKVPYGEDYINYFLLASQKGYCQHFATAATVIFRYLGIPARYAQGYAVDREDFYNSEDVDGEDYTQWISTIYSSDRTVSKISVPDSHGHAWVEVFEEGIGWVPVEATTAQSADEFSPIISTLFGGGRFNGAADTLGDMVKNINADRTKNRIALLAGIIAAFIVMRYLVKTAVIVIKRHRSFSRRNRKASLRNRFAYLDELWKFAKGGNTETHSFGDFPALMQSEGANPQEAEDYIRELEYFLFSGDEPDDEAFDSLTGKTKHYIKFIKGNMKPSKKFKMYFIKRLW